MTDPQATSSANEAVDEMKEWREEGRKRAEEQERKDKEMWEESNEPVCSSSFLTKSFL